MSKYLEKPLSFEGLKTVPIAERGGKVGVSQFARPFPKGGSVQQLVDSFPDILAGQAFRGVLDALQRARSESRAILWGMGAGIDLPQNKPLLHFASVMEVLVWPPERLE